MAFNAFTSVVLDEERNMLIVKGRSDPPLSAETKMFAAVIGVDDTDRRTAPMAVTDSGTDGWHADIPNELVPIDGCDDAKPFTFEDVYLVGSADSPTSGFVLWVNKLPIGAKSG
jgi:hypothetical protein